jgi:large subunit ribosomal protein L13
MTSNEVKPISGQIVIDATDLILGRMASTVAKLVLKGERVIIINAEKALISGNKKNIVEKNTRFPEESPKTTQKT